MLTPPTFVGGEQKVGRALLILVGQQSPKVREFCLVIVIYIFDYEEFLYTENSWPCLNFVSEKESFSCIIHTT